MGAVTTAAAVLAPVFGSATGQDRALRDCDAAIRMPLPVCRRIGFMQLDVHCGASSTAAQVATVLAARRAGPVLAVDASPSPRGLLPLLGATGEPSGALVRSRASTAAEAHTGLLRSPAGCYALDLRPDRPNDGPATPTGPGGPGGPGTPAEPGGPGAPTILSGRSGPARSGDAGSAGGSAVLWSGAVGPIARFFDVVVTDWGLRHPAVDLEPVLAGSSVVCLVVRAEDAALDAAAALLDRLPGHNVVVAAVGRGPRVARRFPRTVVIEDSAGPRSRYRAGCLRLAAELMDPTGGTRRDR